MSTIPEPSPGGEASLPGPSTTAPPGVVGYLPRPFVVRERSSETRDTVTLTLTPAEGSTPPPSFLPGQFNMVSVLGVGEVAISISGDPGQPEQLVHTIRSLGLATQALTSAKPGSTLAIRGPYGRGWPVEMAWGKDVVIIAGGLGIAPLRPLIYALLAQRGRFRRFEVIYGARSPQDLVYYPELQRWRVRTDSRFQVTVDAAGRDWYGDVGLVTQRIPDARFEPKETVAYLCGPEIMMRFAGEALEARGVPSERIYVSLERNMRCGIGLCGHCQLGPYLLCRDGPVLPFHELAPLMRVREI